MAELRESSLLFSLDNLLAHERTRVEDERRTLERCRQAELEAAARRERERVDAEAREALAREERAAAEERRRLDEEARLEGIRRAEIERVAGEARMKHELELLAEARQHELRLAATGASSRARALRNALVGTGLIAAVALIGAFTLEFAVRRPELLRLRADNERALAGERARTDHLRALLSNSESARRELEKRLTHAQNPPLVPAVAATNAPETRPAAPRPARPPRTAPTSRPCRGDPNDPLNPCL